MSEVGTSQDVHAPCSFSVENSEIPFVVVSASGTVTATVAGSFEN